MLLQPKSFIEPDNFYCRAYSKRLTIFNCMSKFVDANALNQKDKPCFNCAKGQEVRLGYAKS